MLITDKQFRALIEVEGPHRVTLYMPTERDGDGRKARENFEQLLQDAADRLQDRGKSKEEALKFLHRAYELLDDRGFWTYLSDGLAVYISDEEFEHYILPLDFESFLYVGRHFYLRPILPVLSGEGRFFLLALGHNDINLYEGTHYSLRPVEIENLIPVDFAEAMKTAYAESDVRMYTGEGPTAKPIQHSRGEKAPKEIRDIRGYFRQIDEGLNIALEGLRAPLILAAPQRLVPVFLDITNYPDTMSFHVEGDPTDFSEEYLHDRAWKQLQEHHKTVKDNYREQFSDMKEAGKAATEDTKVIDAAYEGKVKVLFTQKSAHVWGAYDTDKKVVKFHERRRPDSEDLVERAAVKTFEKGGRVYDVAKDHMPQPGFKMNAAFE